MNIDQLSKKLKKIITEYLKLLVYVFTLLIMIWLTYFVYNNAYTNVISQKEIDKNEIIAKKQKVNITLFNAINNEIIAKKQLTFTFNQELQNPFK